MPLVTPPCTPGALGLLVPPMVPPAVPDPQNPTIGTTSVPPLGSTAGLSRFCADAEEAGATAIWASDHLFWRQPTIECMTAVSVAATATRSAVLGTCVLQLPMRSAAAVAKQASTLQLLSGGRFVLGVGVGSHAEEYVLAGAEFSRRGRRMDDGLVALRSAWATAAGPSPGYRMEPATTVPVWIGGASPAAIRRAAAFGDGWVPLFVGPERFGELRNRLHEEAAAHGRNPDDITAAVVIAVSVGTDTARAAANGLGWLSSLYGIAPKAFARHLVAGSPATCADAAARYHAAGASHVVVMVAGDDAGDQFASLADALGVTGRAAASERARAGSAAPAPEMAGVGG